MSRTPRFSFQNDPNKHVRTVAGLIWRSLIILILISTLFPHPSSPASAAATTTQLVGGDGMTFEERRQAWLNSMPDPDDYSVVKSSGAEKESELDHRVENYLFGWLENCATKTTWNGKCNGAVLTQMIEWFVSTSYWIDKGPKQQRGYAMMIPLKYYSPSPYSGEGVADVISADAYHSVLDRYSEKMIGDGGVFQVGQPNKELASVVGVYLYTSHYDQNIEFAQFGCLESDGSHCLGTHFKSFSYPKSKGGSGVEYTFGEGPYNAHNLIRDWLMYRLDGWFARSGSPYGNREFDSNNYHRHFANMLMLLTQFAPEGDIQSRTKMSADVAILDALMDFSANGWGGTMGRTDYKHMDRSPIFAHRILFGISGDEGGDDKWDLSTIYAVNLAPSNLLVALSRFDEDWRFHMEYNQRLNNAEGKGKWNFLTNDFNMGSSVGQRNQGWNAVIRGPGDTSFIRFFINADSTAPADNQETSYQGDKGYQFRNAMFVNLGNTPHYWEFRSGVAWDEETSQSGWDFKRLGNSFVAIRLGSSTAAVELGQKGIDYSSFSAFKNAIISNADLTSTSFTTSKGIVIDRNDPCGLTSPGDCSFPFDPLETESSHGKLIDWQNGVMTLSKNGLNCTYDFNNWTYSGNSCGTGSPVVPTAFVDVPRSHWAYDYIEILYQEGYIVGCSSNPRKYCPDDAMTRSEGAVFVIRGIQGAGHMPADPALQVFDDVHLSSWAAKWASALWEQEFTAGCGTEPLLYCPDMGHTRAEGAVFYLRMLNGPTYQPPQPSGIFSDVPTSMWYAKWIEQAFAAGIFPACESQTGLKACPVDPLTRATAAYMMVMAKGIDIK
jgi:ferredoxin-like protein FixX